MPRVQSSLSFLLCVKVFRRRVTVESILPRNAPRNVRSPRSYRIGAGRNIDIITVTSPHILLYVAGGRYACTIARDATIAESSGARRRIVIRNKAIPCSLCWARVHLRYRTRLRFSGAHSLARPPAFPFLSPTQQFFFFSLCVPRHILLL